MKPIRLVLLASGRGSHVVNLIEATRDGRLAGQVVRVVSDRPEAAALVQARYATRLALAQIEALLGRRIFESASAQPTDR